LFVWIPFHPRFQQLGQLSQILFFGEFSNCVGPKKKNLKGFFGKKKLYMSSYFEEKEAHLTIFKQ
jgi:hypothetical protein